jgi:membrane-bound serine protease (ClpP class)
LKVPPRWRRPLLASAAILLALGGAAELALAAEPRPVVVEITLDDMVQPVSAEYVKAGIARANQINAAAVLLNLDTPGGLEDSMQEIIEAILQSRVPVITYVWPQGGRAASAGFFILISADVAAMAPGTHAGAAHPVVIGGLNIGKTMETKIENDAAAYIRSIADRRGRNIELAQEAVRQSKSFTEKEALEGRLIDLIANSPRELLAQLDGKTVRRFDGQTAALHLNGATLEPYTMSSRERFLSWIADPNIAFLLGALGLLGLYIEFTHPGLIVPGVVGAIAIVLALFAFHLLPINYLGVILILLALALFALEVKVTSHGALAAGGIVAMIIGAMILVNSPWPSARIRLSTALSVTLPLAVITLILLRVALQAHRRKAVTGDAGMVDSIGVAESDLAPEGKVFVHGELWVARAATPIPKGTRVRVREVRGLTLWVEPDSQSH